MRNPNQFFTNGAFRVGINNTHRCPNCGAYVLQYEDAHGQSRLIDTQSGGGQANANATRIALPTSGHRCF